MIWSNASGGIILLVDEADDRAISFDRTVEFAKTVKPTPQFCDGISVGGA